MSYDIDVRNEIEGSDEIDRALERAITITLQEIEISSASLTVLLTDDEHMRKLNRDFRNLDRSTDVLSFPSGDALPNEMEDLPYLGDIVISVPIAEKQAQMNGHSLKAEIQLLAIHGVLHLLGFDHYLPEEKANMWSAQTKILKLLGLEDIKASED